MPDLLFSVFFPSHLPSVPTLLSYILSSPSSLFYPCLLKWSRVALRAGGGMSRCSFEVSPSALGGRLRGSSHRLLFHFWRQFLEPSCPRWALTAPVADWGMPSPSLLSFSPYGNITPDLKFFGYITSQSFPLYLQSILPSTIHANNHRR